MKRLTVGILALAVLAGITGCGKSEQWQKDKAECIASWGDYRSPEELDAKCAMDADYWEINGKPDR